MIAKLLLALIPFLLVPSSAYAVTPSQHKCISDVILVQESLTEGIGHMNGLLDKQSNLTADNLARNVTIQDVEKCLS